MSVLDDREAYRSNPWLQSHKREYEDFTAFYITVTFCTIVGISLFILNIVLGCCSRYSDYWNDRHTGNRWIISLWTATPHQQPPLDLTELEEIVVPQQKLYQYQIEEEEEQHRIAYTPEPVEYHQLQKRESDI